MKKSWQIKESQSQEQFRTTTVERWERSGLTQREFSRREGIQEWQLSYWKHQVQANRKKRAACEVQVRASDRGLRHGKERARKMYEHKQSTEAQADRSEGSPFVPVQLVDFSEEHSDSGRDVNGSCCVLEVVLRCGRVIRVSSGCQPNFLRAVVSAVECG